MCRSVPDCVMDCCGPVPDRPGLHRTDSGPTSDRHTTVADPARFGADEPGPSRTGPGPGLLVPGGSGGAGRTATGPGSGRPATRPGSGRPARQPASLCSPMACGAGRDRGPRCSWLRGSNAGASGSYSGVIERPEWPGERGGGPRGGRAATGGVRAARALRAGSGVR